MTHIMNQNCLTVNHIVALGVPHGYINVDEIAQLIRHDDILDGRWGAVYVQLFNHASSYPGSRLLCVMIQTRCYIATGLRI